MLKKQFFKNLRPFFLAKDARELGLILEKVYIYGFNFQPHLIVRRAKP